MRQWFFFFWAVFLNFQVAAAQEKQQEVYFERSGEGLVRFYFDQNYFLVDKNCEFKTIERLASFDITAAEFNGSFTDFDQQGRIILEGSYVSGLKHGLFKAFHINGSLKWEVNYEKDKPIGEMTYYYPDGKPMLVLAYNQGITSVKQYITKKGSASVKDGNGYYEMIVPFQGYNPYGYSFLKHKGRIKNGFPTGYWQVFSVEGKSQVLSAEEYYKNGVFTEGYDLFLESGYAEPLYSKVPIDNFSRAELLVSKSCSYDDHVGFTFYLGEYFTQGLARILPKKDFEESFEYTVQVNKDGKASKLEMSNELSAQLNKLFLQIAKSIDHYIPSFIAGQYIEDELKISGKITTGENGKLIVHSIKVGRKQEP